MLPGIDELRKTEMIEEAFDLFTAVQIDLKDKKNDDQLVYLQKILRLTSEQNYKLFFMVNYKIAKRLLKKAQSADMDLAGANRAIIQIREASKALARAKRAELIDAYSEEHGKDEKLPKLKEDLEKLDYQ